MNFVARRQSLTRARFTWDSLADTFMVSRYEVIVQDSEGTSLRVFSSGRDVTEAVIDGLSNSKQYTARVFAVGLESGTSMVLPGPGSNSVAVPCKMS